MSHDICVKFSSILLFHRAKYSKGSVIQTKMNDPVVCFAKGEYSFVGMPTPATTCKPADALPPGPKHGWRDGLLALVELLYLYGHLDHFTSLWFLLF